MGADAMTTEAMTDLREAVSAPKHAIDVSPLYPDSDAALLSVTMITSNATIKEGRVLVTDPRPINHDKILRADMPSGGPERRYAEACWAAAAAVYGTSVTEMKARVGMLLGVLLPRVLMDAKGRPLANPRPDLVTREGE